MSESDSGSARKNPRSPFDVARSSSSACTLVEPLGDGPASEIGGDWRNPTAARRVDMACDRISERRGQPIPPT